MAASPEFYKVSGIDSPAEYLKELVAEKLSGSPVFWLIPGGSAANVATAAGQKLAADPPHQLIITLTDERYGEPGHTNSNWQLFGHASLPGTKIPVLDGRPFKETVSAYEKSLEKYLAGASYKIGLFGIGTDGHTAGILPDSPAVSSRGLAAGYKAADYLRITMTPRAITQLDRAVVYAVGKEKHPVIKSLEENIDISVQPAQILKQAGRLVIFNDYKGEII